MCLVCHEEQWALLVLIHPLTIHIHAPLQDSSLQNKLESLTSERDALRRQVSDQAQQQKKLEAQITKMLTQSATADDTNKGDSCVDRHTPWTPSAERDKKDPDLAAFMRNVAKNNEILVAVSNANYAWPGGMLELWMRCVKNAGVENAMIVALDDETKENVEKFGLPAFRIDMEVWHHTSYILD